MTKKELKTLYKIMARNGDWRKGKFSCGSNWAIADRVKLAADLAAADVEGKVAFNVTGMDCDCVKVWYGKVIPTPTLFAAQRMINIEYDHAEGPVSAWFDKPENAQANESRDLALEAFEDGHPWVVFA